MSHEANRVRLLPWTGAHGQPCLLVTDGDGSASRLADRIEDAQLCLADRLLGRTRDVLAERGVSRVELGMLTGQLADALSDALLIAESRGARLGGRWQPLPDEGPEALPRGGVVRDPLSYTPAAELRAYGLLTLPGRDLASAPLARRYVRDTALAWRLPPRTTDDLETVTAELVANALEHSESHIVTVSCALTAETATITVTDEGDGPVPVDPVPPHPPGPERENGRGLLITDALATRWGTSQSGHGLTVWAEVPVGASGGPAR